MPVGPGFDIENARWRIGQNLSEPHFAQQRQRQNCVMPIPKGHDLRQKPRDVLEPGFRFAPPKNAPSDGQQCRSNLTGHGLTPVYMVFCHCFILNVPADLGKGMGVSSRVADAASANRRKQFGKIEILGQHHG